MTLLIIVLCLDDVVIKGAVIHSQNAFSTSLMHGTQKHRDVNTDGERNRLLFLRIYEMA